MNRMTMMFHVNLFLPTHRLKHHEDILSVTETVPDILLRKPKFFTYKRIFFMPFD